jgi:hypothetical protein
MLTAGWRLGAAAELTAWQLKIAGSFRKPKISS